jgi:hypothetical protein
MFRENPRSLRRTTSGFRPNLAIPGVRSTPRPREPKATPGTVAFPLAPLQCRSSIYTTSSVENPPELKNRVKQNQGADRCENEVIRSVPDRTARWFLVAKRSIRKSSTSRTTRRGKFPFGLAWSKLESYSGSSACARRGSQRCNPTRPFCKLCASCIQVFRFSQPRRMKRECNIPPFPRSLPVPDGRRAQELSGFNRA